MATTSTRNAPLEPGPDGRYHPADEAEVAALVRYAAIGGRRLRVRGAGHAPIGTVAGDDPRDLVVTLERMSGLRLLDEGERLVEADAGIHLGFDPAAAELEGSIERSLLYQLAEHHGWTLSSTGGITHQTLGGFLATTSAGGTLQHSMLDHVVAVRLVDGRGETRTFSEDDGPGLAAVLPSLGLLGVITAVTLRCEDLFAITGQEAIVTLADSGIDLEGPGRDGCPSLARFLTEVEYARIEWWPQRGAERLLIWQAQRMTPQAGFRPTAFEEFTRYPVLAEVLISTLYVTFGNLGHPDRVGAILRRNADHVEKILGLLVKIGYLQPRRRQLARVMPVGLRLLARLAPTLRLIGPLLRRALPWLVPRLLGRVLVLDTHRPGLGRGEPQAFRDWGWRGLPMDNQASDTLLASGFSELWVPMPRAAEVMRLLRAYFAEPARPLDAFHRTGLFAYELYGAPAAAGWLHPGHSDGDDEWREGSLRVDVYWFSDNAEDPHERFFPQFWELLRDHEIPFRLHWGKEQPASSPADRRWLELLSSRYPRWHDFLALRAECDPDEVFLTNYWRDRLGLWERSARAAPLS